MWLSKKKRGLCNLHVSMTPFRNESRLLREIDALHESELIDHTVVVALWEDGLAEFATFDRNCVVYRLRLITRRLPRNIFFQQFKYFELLIRTVQLSLHHNAAVINCHALALLPIGRLVKFLTLSKLVYDAHELETERNGLIGFRKKVSVYLERWLIVSADLTIVPGEMIARHYRKKYGIHSVVSIRNVPTLKHLKTSSRLRDELGIDAKKQIALYHGALSSGRGLESLLEAFASRRDDSLVLVLMGYGELEEHIQKYQNNNPQRIYLKSAVPPEHLLQYASGADYGLSLIEPVCLSYYYCLPNKLFEYMAVGLPILATRLPEIELVMKNWPSVLLENLKAKDIQAGLEKISKLERRPMSSDNPGEYTWANEKNKLTKAYKEMLA